MTARPTPSSRRTKPVSEPRTARYAAEHFEESFGCAPMKRGLIASFRLPLDACPPQNRMQVKRAWQYSKTKERCWKLLVGQYLKQFGRVPSVLDPPHVGRTVVCTRHSSVEPDRWSDWAKIPVDLLCTPKGRQKHGLGLIYDDAPRYATIEQRWEKAPRGDGYVSIEVYE